MKEAKIKQTEVVLTVECPHCRQDVEINNPVAICTPGVKTDACPSCEGEFTFNVEKPS